MLEFLSAQFVHPCTLQPTILSILKPSKKTYNKLFFFDYNDFITFEVFK